MICSRVGDTEGSGEVISSKECRLYSYGGRNVQGLLNVKENMGEWRGRLKSKVEVHANQNLNLGSGFHVIRFMGEFLSPQPEPLESRVFLAHLVSLKPSRVSACPGHSINVD